MRDKKRPSFVRRVVVAAYACALAAALLPAASSLGGEIEDPSRIRRLAENHAQEIAARIAPLDASISVQAARLDPRLRLPLCPVTPETFSASERLAAQTTVGVRCPTSAAWSLYVPVRIDITTEVVVLATPESRGAALTPRNLRLDMRNIAELTGGYLTNLNDAQGMVLRRPARAGTILSPTLLERPRIVRRGERVRITSGATQIAVSSEGQALADAAEGDRLKVKNLRSGLVIEGTVASNGAVVVDN